MNLSSKTVLAALGLALALTGCTAAPTTEDHPGTLTDEEIEFSADVLSGAYDLKVEAAGLLTEFNTHLVQIAPVAEANLETAFERTREIIGGPIPDTADEMNALPAETLTEVVEMMRRATAADVFFDTSNLTPADEALVHVQVLRLAGNLATLPEGTAIEYSPDSVSVDVDARRAEIDLVAGERVLPDGTREPFEGGSSGVYVYSVVFDGDGRGDIDGKAFLEMLE